jgi:hypothetical protein
MKKSIYSLFIAALQIAVFIICHDVGLKLHKIIFGPPRPDLNWGITVEFAFFLFAVLAILSTSLCLFLNIRKKSWLVLSIAFLIFTYFRIDDFGYSPLRALLLVISAAIGFFSFFPLYKIISGWPSRQV